MDSERLAILLAALRSKEIGPFDLKHFLFDRQLEFVEDKAPFKVAVCSRRSGKTVSCAAHLIDTSLSSDSVVCLYITLSRNNAKKIVWPEIQSINRMYMLGGKEDQTELSMRFPNGSVIYLSGAKDTSEIEKFRGLALKLCYIDETQSFRPFIKGLIDDVIGPALIDHAGTLCLIGTPGPIPAGYFYDCWASTTAWSKHAWTFWNNPHISKKSGLTHQQLLQRELDRRGVTVDDPSIQREWFGQWVLDSDSLLLHYDKTKNDYDELPPGNYDYIIGCDVGYIDADALAVIAWSEKSNTSYLVDESVVHKQTLSGLASQTTRLIERYNPSKIVIDEGGLGKKLAEEMRRRFHIPFQPAEKTRKMENLAILNDALRSGRFKAKTGSRFAQDCYLMEIDKDKTTPEKIRVSDRYHSDIIDAVLYGYRESPAFTYVPEIPKPKYGTPEWAEKEVTDMERAAEEHFRSLEDIETINKYI